MPLPFLIKIDKHCMDRAVTGIRVLGHSSINQVRIAWNSSVRTRNYGDNLMKKFLPVLALLSAGMATAIPHAFAETASAAPHKKLSKHAPKHAAAKASDDDKAPDLAGHTRFDFNCELGNKVTVYENTSDANRIGLRWHQKMHELTRVATTTGAHRFEDKDAGLVWINIPAKGMLLDSKKGQQLANECRSISG